MVVSSVTPRRREADPGPPLRVLLEGGAQHIQEDPAFLGLVLGGGRHGAGGFEFDALVHQHRGVAAVVQDHVRAQLRIGVGARPGEDLLGSPPVFLEGFALPGEHRNTLGVLDGAGAHDYGGGGLVLGGEDVAGCPADLGPERGEGLDEDGGLHGHVERAGDPRALQRLAGAEFLAERHQPRHLVLGEADLVAAGLGQGDVGNLVIECHGSPLLYPASCLLRCGLEFQAVGRGRSL